MASRLAINLNNIYPVLEVGADYRTAVFESILVGGAVIRLSIKIGTEETELLGNVFNLAFGPLNRWGRIDDNAEVHHKDPFRVFSTILFIALNFLQKNPGKLVGIDGSDNRRAYYYWRVLQRNHDYLNLFFRIYGIMYFVRISRFGKQQYDNPFDFDDIQSIAVPITKLYPQPEHMFNYFTLGLNGDAGGF